MESGRLPPVSHLVYAAVVGGDVLAGEHPCYICGFEGDGRKLDLPDQFMDHARCEGRGTTICAGCEHVFAPPGYRRFGSALITAHELRAVGRKEWDALLFGSPWPTEPYALAISLAKKKNVIPWAPVNAPGVDPVVQYEHDRVRFDREQLAPVRAAFRALYEHHSKASILADEWPYLAQMVRRGGSIEAWQAHRAVLRPWLGSIELELIGFATAKEDSDGAGNTD